jgi:Zn finger protein HypA/HybF involved in hydrogenase expression
MNKEGKIVGIAAIEIKCEECDELCVNVIGSYLITPDNETVQCEHCHQEYKVPSTAFVYREMNTRVRRK